jgi:hypothetical protein
MAGRPGDDPVRVPRQGRLRPAAFGARRSRIRTCAYSGGTRTPVSWTGTMAIRVECYAGYRGDQEPVAFWLGERRLAVRAILDRWHAPATRWFRVDADDGNLYVLRHDDPPGDWQVAAFTAHRSPGAPD